MTTVFVTMSAYHLGRVLGLEGAFAEINGQLEAPTLKSLPGVRTIHRLRHLADVQVRLDTGATCIGKARSRAFSAALDSRCDVWVSVDDDVEASSDTLGWMLQAVWGVTPNIVIAPCALRRNEAELDSFCTVNVQMPAVRVERRLLSGGTLVQVEGGGYGLVACNRAALQAIAEAHPSLRFVDDDGAARWGVFHDALTDDNERGEMRWYGEDLSYFRRARTAGVTIEALTNGITAHAGLPLELARLR